jgi:hypothetical protein
LTSAEPSTDRSSATRSTSRSSAQDLHPRRLQHCRVRPVCPIGSRRWGIDTCCLDGAGGGVRIPKSDAMIRAYARVF